MASEGDPGLFFVALYLVLGLAAVAAACVLLVKAVNGTRRWWRRRRGLSDDLDDA